MNYQELNNKIAEDTNDFSRSRGFVYVGSKAELEIAEDILSKVYNIVDKLGLDYTHKDPNGLNYKIEYREPKFEEGYHYMNEAMIEKHDQLNPKLWDKNNELRPEVKDKIELVVNKFKENLFEDNINIDIVDTILVGSNCSYNYNDTSDLDIHIIVDLRDYSEEVEILADKLYNAYRRLFNDRYEISLNGIPAEIYVETLKNGD